MNVLEWSRRKSDYFSGQLLLRDVKYTFFIDLFIYLFEKITTLFTLLTLLTKLTLPTLLTYINNN